MSNVIEPTWISELVAATDAAADRRTAARRRTP
jgi:hypothetical protein